LAIAAALAVGVPVVALLIAGPGAHRGPQATPEAALRTFYVASALGDEATLRKVTLPASDFELLLRSKRVPEGKVDEFRRSIARMQIRRLKPGAPVKLPDGRLIAIDPKESGADHAWVHPEGTAYPTELRRVDGLWKVDARPVIEARRREDEARRIDEARRRAGH
jgi:hypothetical protein